MATWKSGLLASILVAVLQSAVRGNITSTFDTDAEGWFHGFGDVNSQVIWSAAGGNPGGRLTMEDAAAGATDYWYAPAKYLGNQGGAYLGELSYDVKIDPAGVVFADIDVALVGGGHSVSGLFNVSPTSDYTHVSILLKEGSQWHYDGSGGGPPTAAAFQEILANLTSLQIRADHLNGLEVDSLDNVSLTSVPEPGVVIVLAGAAGLLPRRRKSKS